MKKRISICLFFCSIFTFAQGIKFEENIAFNDALAKAKKEKKIIFVDAFASWCGPCKMMSKNIFTLKTVGDFYNKNFINLAIDMEKGEGREVAKKYSVYSYPTYLFINGDGELLQKDVGYIEEQPFVSLGEETLNTLKFGSLKTRFEKGENKPEFLVKVIKQYYQSDYELAKKASEIYFKQKKDVLKNEDIGLLFTFIKSPKDYNFLYATEHKSEITKLISEDQYNNFINPLKINIIMEESFKDNKFNEKYFLEKATPILGENEALHVKNQLLLQYYLEQKDYKNYETLVLNLYKNPDNISEKELSEAAKIFVENIKTPSSLITAQVWAEKSVMMNENADNTFTLAKLLYLNGKKEMAKGFAKLSKSLSEKNNLNTQSIDEFIKKIQ
jgi:thiol-disulfide isomerase/thioredoxin